MRAPRHRQHHDSIGAGNRVGVGCAFDRPRRAGHACSEIGRDLRRPGGIARAHDDVDAGKRAALRQAAALGPGASDHGNCHGFLPRYPGRDYES